MSASRSARPDDEFAPDDKNPRALQDLSLSDLYGAIDRTAERIRADLLALDGEPVALPDYRWPMPTSPTGPPSGVEAARVKVQPTILPVMVSSPVGQVRTQPGPRRWLRWILGMLILVPALGLLILAIIARLPGAATATGSVATSESSPLPMSGAFASVAASSPAFPAATPTPETSPTLTVIPMVVAPIAPVAAIPTAMPTTLPMATPTQPPTATPQPTAMLLPTPTLSPPTPTPPSSAALVSRVAELEAGLRSGRFDVAIEYGQGHRSVVIVQFDFGGPGGVRRVAFDITSSGLGGEQRMALLMIGDQVWQREPGGSWQPGVSQDGLWEQFHAYLPQIRAVRDPSVAQAGAVLTLRWADLARGAELELQIAASDGRPLLLREVTPADGMVMVVTYTGWNTPVSIASPGP